MPTLQNPLYGQSPLGQAVGNLLGAFAKARVNEANQAYRDAQIEAANAKTAGTYSKLAGQSRLADVILQAMQPAPEQARPETTFTGPMPQMSRDEYLAPIIPQIQGAGIQAGIKPEDLGSLVYQTLGNAGASDSVRARALPKPMGKDEVVSLEDRNALQDRLAAAAEHKAIAEVFAKPSEVSAGGTTVFAPNDPRAAMFPGGRLQGRDTKATAEGAAFNALSPEARAVAVGPDESHVKGNLLSTHFNNLPNMPPSQQHALGGEPNSQTPRNYVTADGRRGITLDGTTDAATGADVPGGSTVYTGQVQGSDVGSLTGTTRSAVQQSTLANDRFLSLLGTVRELAKKDPNNFGIPGVVKGAVQDANQVAQAVATGLGFKSAQDALDNMRAEITKGGVDPDLFSGVFDPNLPALQAASLLLTYSGAAALAGQSGRSVTDRDVKNFKEILGDPTSLFTNQAKFLSKLDLAERLVRGQQAATDSFSSGGKKPPPKGGSAGGTDYQNLSDEEILKRLGQ